MLSNWNILFWEYEFLAPYWLWLLLLVPFILFFLLKKEKNRKGDFMFSQNETAQHNLATNWISKVRKTLIYAYVFVYILLVFAIAKPFHWKSDENIEQSFKNGIDIVLAMDVSISMLARDFQPNRLEASREVAKKFIDGRIGDRIGLVIYAGEAYTACPTTLDYDVLKQQLDNIDFENLEPGTAIGTGLGTAVARITNDSVPSKVIILLTDGSNNAGEITPLMAAELAKAKNVRVYTIGVGTNGEALSPVVTSFGIRYEYIPVEIDEATLQNIAKTTGGKYFRATDEKSLVEIYKEIEKLEKYKILDKRFHAEPPATPRAFLNWAILILIVTFSVNYLVFKFND